MLQDFAAYMKRSLSYLQELLHNRKEASQDSWKQMMVRIFDDQHHKSSQEQVGRIYKATKNVGYSIEYMKEKRKSSKRRTRRKGQVNELMNEGLTYGQMNIWINDEL